jgi:hypothetical protein
MSSVMPADDKDVKVGRWYSVTLEVDDRVVSTPLYNIITVTPTVTLPDVENQESKLAGKNEQDPMPVDEVNVEQVREVVVPEFNRNTN